MIDLGEPDPRKLAVGWAIVAVVAWLLNAWPVVLISMAGVVIMAGFGLYDERSAEGGVA